MRYRKAEDHRGGHDDVTWGEILRGGFATGRGLAVVRALAELVWVYIVDVQDRSQPYAGRLGVELRLPPSRCYGPLAGSARKPGLSMTSKPVDKDVQLARIAHRQATTPHQTFPMSEAEVDQWREQFQVPDAAELPGVEIPGPPAGWSSWPEWAADHWPSCTES